MSASTPPATAEFKTAICEEQPCADNPFVAQQRYLKGYACDELWRHAQLLDVVLLHFLDELPGDRHRAMTNCLMIGLMNLGPRQADTRAAMVAGISKTRPEHLLPLGLLAGQGHSSGALAVAEAHRFIQKNARRAAGQCLQNLLAAADDGAPAVPGFGTVYGSRDPLLQALAADVQATVPDSPVFAWCSDLLSHLGEYQQGWLAPGVMAACGLELGLRARETMGLYQFIRSLSILAFGLEQSHAPLKHAPLLDEQHYEFKHTAR